MFVRCLRYRSLPWSDRCTLSYLLYDSIIQKYFQSEMSLLARIISTIVVLVIVFELPLAVAQIPAGIEVRSGLFIPVNNTATNNNGNNAYNRPPQTSYNQYNQPGNNYPYNQNTYPAYNYNNANIPANLNNYGTNKNNGFVRNTSVPVPRDVVFGSRVNGDQKLFLTLVTKGLGWLRSSVSKVIVFPDPSSQQRISQITSIIVTDNTKDGSGGHAQIVSGGVGRPFVEIKFKSAPNKKIDLGLKIFGFQK